MGMFIEIDTPNEIYHIDILAYEIVKEMVVVDGEIKFKVGTFYAHKIEEVHE